MSCKKYFRGLGNPRNILTVLNDSTFPGSVIRSKTAHQENMEYEQLTVFVVMYHTAVGKLLA